MHVRTTSFTLSLPTKQIIYVLENLGLTLFSLQAKLEKINEGWCRMDATITSRLYDLEAALKVQTKAPYYSTKGTTFTTCGEQITISHSVLGNTNC